MKNIKKLLYASAIMILSLTSCKDDEYALVPVPEGQEVYFSESLSTTITLDMNGNSVSVPVMRIKTDEAETVQLMSEDESGLFTVPTSVSFAAGSDTADIVIGYNADDLTYGESYPVSLLVMGNDSEWGLSQVSLNLVYPEPWTALGTATWREDFLTTWFSGDNLEWEVTVEENDLTPGLYRLVNVYTDAILEELFGGTGLTWECWDTYLVIDATDPDHVWFPYQEVGVDMGYGSMWILSYITDYWNISESAYGTLADGIITFPKESVVIMDDDGPAFAGTSGLMRIVLPGADLSDYSMGIVYDGMKTSTQGDVTALINLSIGADVASYKWVVAAGDVTNTLDTVVAAIVDGSAENIGSGSATDSALEIAIEEAGIYSFVAVPYSADGSAVTGSASMTSFYFPGSAGGEIPDVECTLELGYVADIMGNPAYETTYPSYSCLGYVIEGKELKSMKLYRNTTEIIEGAAEEGLTYQDLLENYGADGSSMISDINEEGYYVGALSGLRSSTSYTVLLLVENIYGKKVILSASYSTADIPYSGSLVLGTYHMYCTYGDHDWSNEFTLSATTQENVFLLTDLGIENGASLWANYDPDTHTLSCNGLESGYEDYGSVFGGLYGYFNTAKTQVYGYFSYADATGESGDDPAIFKVDETTNTLSSLETYLIIPVFDYNGQQTTALAGYYNYFIPGSTIELVSSTSAVKASKRNAASTLREDGGMRAVDLSNRYLNLTDRRYKQETDNMSRIDCGLRTVKVKATACERRASSKTKKHIDNDKLVMLR